MSILSLKLLRDAGLSPDWMTVYVGWLGFDSLFGLLRLPAQDVQDFAYERIGNGSVEEDYDAVHLIDIDARTTSLWNEERFLKQLAARSPIAPELARRKWRLAHWVSYQPSLIKSVAEPLDDEERFSCQWVISCYEDLWGNFVNHPPLPESLANVDAYDGKDNLRKTVGEMTRWTTEERQAIIAEEKEAERN